MIKTGLDVLIHERLDWLRGRRVGLATQPAAVLPNLSSAVDALLDAGIHLAVLFGPEHGYDGSAADGAAVLDGIDPNTGLPIYSLYGINKEPTPEMLAQVDAVVFDMQDVGVRFYTFISTLFYILRAAGKAGKPVLVLDRPNPINGICIEGPPIEPGFESFIGIVSLPIRHGMTCGELARYFVGEFGLGTDLTVVGMRGWERRMWFNQTGLPWVPPSPAMPRLSTATVYPGMCFIEGTNVSTGRGTALPFESVGAPWLDANALARVLNGLERPGVRFRPTHFLPGADKFAGEVCHGVQVHVTDRAAFRPVETGLDVVAACRAQAPEHFCFLPVSTEGTIAHFDLLAGDAHLRERMIAGTPVQELAADWVDGTVAFARARAKYLLYE